MSTIPDVVGWFSRRSYPRLVALATVGAAVGAVGTVLLAVASGGGDGLRALGLRVAVFGYLVFLFGASGYAAFSLFERGFDRRRSPP